MQELFHVAIELVNLPWTVLLGVFLLYWCLMILGIFDLDSFDGHFEFGHDAHVDAGVHGHGAEAPSGGFLHSLLHFLNLGDVPVMVVGTVVSLSGWVMSMIGNHHFNPDYSLVRGAVLLIPILIVCVIVTHFATLPLRAVFKRLNEDETAKVDVVGKVAQVTSGEVNASFGQATIDLDGVPITLNARAPKETSFPKGTRVLVIDEDKEKRTYNVIRYQEPE